MDAGAEVIRERSLPTGSAHPPPETFGTSASAGLANPGGDGRCCQNAVVSAATQHVAGTTSAREVFEAVRNTARL